MFRTPTAADTDHLPIVSFSSLGDWQRTFDAKFSVLTNTASLQAASPLRRHDHERSSLLTGACDRLDSCH